MTKIEHSEFKAEINLKAVELLNNSLQLPPVPSTSITNFNFNINIESRADSVNKLVFVIVNIEIKNEEQSFTLGTIVVSCIFEIGNFHDVIKADADGKVDIPDKLLETLNIISISTTRGVMFMTFKGTFLHNAILPIIDPKQFQPK